MLFLHEIAAQPQILFATKPIIRWHAMSFSHPLEPSTVPTSDVPQHEKINYLYVPMGNNSFSCGLGYFHQYLPNAATLTWLTHSTRHH